MISDVKFCPVDNNDVILYHSHHRGTGAFVVEFLLKVKYEKEEEAGDRYATPKIEREIDGWDARPGPLTAHHG